MKKIDIDKALACAPLLGEPASEVVTEALLELRAARERIAELEAERGGADSGMCAVTILLALCRIRLRRRSDRGRRQA